MNDVPPSCSKPLASGIVAWVRYGESPGDEPDVHAVDFAGAHDDRLERRLVTVRPEDACVPELMQDALVIDVRMTSRAVSVLSERAGSA